jgi:CheY-like chemotaxis protein
MENSDSGWHLLELLQADPTTALIPLVVCSADQLQLEEREGWLCQRDMRFLLKPFDLDELDALLDDLLSSRSMGLGASES